MAETVKPQLASHDHCTGCGACASGCPKGAVHMVRDKEGFLYPQITDGCVGCGHCAHVCPALKQREVRSAPAVFAVWNEDEAVRAHSTAGGVFTALAEFALECGGVVFGAALDEKLQVRHIVVKNKEDLRLLRGAKPIQSELGETYQQVQMYLEQRRFVLFCGTPCQVDGLYRFLGEHPENLLTCDFACSGVGSPGVRGSRFSGSWSKMWAPLTELMSSRDIPTFCCWGWKSLGIVWNTVMVRSPERLVLA